MSATLKLGTDGNWAAKKGSVLSYNDENGNFKPLPFTFDRSTSATRVNKQGLIEVVSNNEPRIDFLNDSKGALKLEPSRSNIITYSEDLTNTAWDNVAYPVTITSNSIISPDGSLNGTLITPSSGNSRHAIRNLSASAVSGTTYMLSVFVKKGGSRYIVFGDAGDNLWRVVTFDLDNGVVTNEYNSDGTITSYGNGWYRITCKITRTNAGTVQFSLGASETNSNSGLPSFDNTSLTVYAYGCQIESNSSYATSYIPTQGSIGTRVAESSSQTPPSGIIGQTEGTLFADIYLNLAGSNIGFYALQVYDNSFSPSYGKAVYLELYQGKVYGYARNSTVQCEILSGIYADGQRLKMALAYKSNDFALYVNGVQIGIDTNGSLPSGLNDVSLHYSAGVQQASPLSQAQLYNTRLSNAELQALTTI